MSTGAGPGTETVETIELFIEQTGITFGVLHDVAGSYKAFAFPKAISPYPRQVLIGAGGTVLYLNSEHDDAALRLAIEAAP